MFKRFLQQPFDVNAFGLGKLIEQQNEEVRMYRREDFQEKSPAVASSPLDQAVGYIQSALNSASHSDEKIALMLEAKDFTERVSRFIEDDLEKRLGKLKAEFAEVNLECRASRDRLRKLQLEVAPLETNRMNVLIQKSGEANARAKEVRVSQPRDDDFPTDQEIKNWEALYKEAAEAVSDAAAAEGRLQHEIALKNNDIARESAKFEDLKQKRKSIKEAMEGQTTNAYSGTLNL